MLDKSKIENMVWEKFPATEGEKKCASERDTMNMLRQNYRNKLYEQYKAEQAETASKTKTSVQV